MATTNIGYVHVAGLAALENGCLGKEKHETMAAAFAAQQFRVRDGTTRSGSEGVPYECPFCTKWHLGH